MKAADDIHHGYVASFVEFSSPESVDDKVDAVMNQLRTYNPDLLFFYGNDGNRRLLGSASDFPAVRRWIKELCGDTSTSVKHDLGFFIGFDMEDPCPGGLSVRCDPDDGLFWAFNQSRSYVRALFGDPARLASDVFRRLIQIIRPYRGDWFEFRNVSLIYFGSTQWDTIRENPVPWLPTEYPSSAIPAGWLRVPKAVFEYPQGVWWFNYWGPELVELAGIDVLRSMPVKHFEELEDGCMFWLCDELFTIDNDQHLAAQREVLEYLDARGVLQRFGLR